MTQAPAKHEKYLSDFRALEKQLAADGPPWLNRIREHALGRFAELGFPTARRGNEKWKYTNVGPLANATFTYPRNGAMNGLARADIQATAPWHESWVNLVFVDGHYSEELSTVSSNGDGVRVGSLAEAISSGEDVVEQHLARYASAEDDAFTALNTAFIQDGAFVHIPNGHSLDSPVHLVFVSTQQDEPTVSYPRVLVVAGAGSKATVIESYVGLSENRYFTNGVTEMFLERDSQIEHYRILAESDSAFNVCVCRVHQEENSTFSSGAFYRGAALGRYDLNVLLDGPGSTCNLTGLYITSGTQHIDNFINIDHAKPHGTSRLYYKGILDGKSRAVFGGTVWVREGAIKTDSLQTDKNLVLSPDAEVDSKPALFIYADDVKCGHGATAGNIDKDTVFYIRSRGLDLETASGLLIFGFASEIIEMVRVDELRSYLERLFLSLLPRYSFEF